MNVKRTIERLFLSTAKQLVTVLALCIAVNITSATPVATASVAGHFQRVEGIDVFYRESGATNSTVLLLLHGFPSSSFYFRNLMPLLGRNYHVIAPDYPGFGYSDAPAVDKYVYTFDHLGAVAEKFLEAKKITNCFIYMQDYGGPVGMRVAVDHPEWVAGLVFQNANVYQEGLLERFFLKKPLWDKRTGATEAPVLRNMEFDSVKYQYVHGARHPDEMTPDAWTMDLAFLARPGNKAIQLELQADYGNNLTKYPAWQEYLRRRQPPTLVVWGKNDPIFGPKGAEAFLRDVPKAEVHLLDTGHFALEEDVATIAEYFQNFVERSVAERGK